MKEDGRRPVTTRSDDSAPPAGGEGVQLLSLGAAPGRHLQRLLSMAGVVQANVGQNVTPHNPSLGLFLYHFLHTMVS
jgi:hypothetical protein